MKIFDIGDKRFQKYGSVVEGYDFSEVIRTMKTMAIPEEIEYVASEKRLECLPVFGQFRDGFYGGMPVELGYCMGHNRKLNALEYHRGTEVNISVTDYIVMLGLQQDITKDHCYDTSKVELFYVPAGMAVQFYATTLHYCACHIHKEGYSHATFLPQGTNCPLDGIFVPRTEEDLLLAAKNKWILVHSESDLAQEFPVKLVGENINLDDVLEKSV